MTVVALSSHGYWGIALGIGLAAALVVAVLLEVAPAVAANTSNIPQLQATAPVLAQIVDEAVVQDGYMNALTDGFGEK